MESFSKLRHDLNELGYTQTLKPECVPLVDRLISDLKTTTESLKKYMKISQQAIEERDNLELGAEPYKCDNAKLIKECNELHLAFIQFKEQHEKVQKDLKIQITLLENKLEESNIVKENLKKLVIDLETQLAVAARRRGEKSIFHTQSVSKTAQRTTGKSGFQLNTAMAHADQKVAYLNKEIKKLKDEQLQFVKNNEFYKVQLKNRDEEIRRLNSLLEGGRPPKAISEECCYKNIDNKIGAFQDEINKLKGENNSLHNQLKEALSKQHEAMRRALHLAERNKQLEKEMKDIDQIALAVEAECNNKVQSNAEKVTRLQDRMNESIIMIQNLERENVKLKLESKELSLELDAIKVEKRNLQALLETEATDKKRLTDRINSFTIIERDLNMEIDRLVRISGEQKMKISELEGQVMAGRIHGPTFDLTKPTETDNSNYLMKRKQTKQQVDITKSPTKPKKTTLSDRVVKSKSTASKRLEHKKTCKKSVQKSSVEEDKSVPPLMTDFGSQMEKCCCEAGGCVKSMKELLDKEMEFRQAQAMQQIESLKQEKDYYMKEYHKLADEMRNIPTHDKSDKLQQQYEELLRAIGEKNRTITELQNEVKVLSQEKYTLMNKSEVRTAPNHIEADDVCHNITCKRKCRELEVHREELKYLEKENNTLKEKIHALNESTVFDQERMKKAFQDMEEHIRKLENERRELVVNQCTSRSNMSQLEEECKFVKEQLRTTQNELNNLKANYTQLKNLHDQTDRALSEAQNKLLRAETELQSVQSKMQNTHRESATNEREIATLQGDIEVMKSQLTKLDKEKDDLLNVVDEKTEKIDQLENQLKEKKNLVTNLEYELKELKRKLSKASEETASQQLHLRSSRQEVTVLEKDVETERKLKESALHENRRLQDDLASVTCDCREARKELEISRRQVEDLKRQLQHYVAEVKRTEDLISQKELERAEVLDQFKCLSEEANVLESNNHTLENEASQTRVQLSVALDHASDLERKLENQESIIHSYERQIADLTSQIASLEIQMKQGTSHQDRVMVELKQMKDLCIKLDQEKDEMKRELRSREDQKGLVEKSIDRFARENEELKRALEKDQNKLDGLERLLAEARQEVIEQRLLNQDLQSEINKMKFKIDELQERVYPPSPLTPPIPAEINIPVSKTGFYPTCYQFCNKDKCVISKKSKVDEENEKNIDEVIFKRNTEPISDRICNENVGAGIDNNEELSNKVEDYSGEKNKQVEFLTNEEKSTQTVQPMIECKKFCPVRKEVGVKTDYYTINISTYAKSNASSSSINSVVSSENSASRRAVADRSAENESKSVNETANKTIKYIKPICSGRNEVVEALDSPELGKLSAASSRSVQIDKGCKVGTFKNVFKLEGPGIECSISSYKTVHSKRDK